MAINKVNNITDFYNISSDVIGQAAAKSSTVTVAPDGSFGGFLSAAVNQLNETNSYLKNAEEEEVKWALGLSDNTHDLALAQTKAETALQYTVALRDKFVAAYREIMQMQI